MILPPLVFPALTIMTASMEDVAASKLEQKGGVAILKGRADAENFFTGMNAKA